MSDVVAELRALLAEYAAVDAERYFVAEDRWDVQKKILERLFPSLGALLDMAEAARPFRTAAYIVRQDGTTGDAEINMLGRAFARLDGEEGP